MEKLNIAEILKDCPKGMKLYTTVWGEVEFIKVCDFGTITILPTSNPYNTSNTKILYSNGRFTLNGECVLFPSKENRDWSKFHRPFEDGDILTNEKGSIFIYKGPMCYNKMLSDFYCGYRKADGAFVPKLFKDRHFGDGSECRFATEKEKQQLFDAIEENGYKWNAETKTLEKLIDPKFKVGDRIKNRIVRTNNVYTVVGIKGLKYFVNMNNEKHNYEIDFEVQDDWELAPNKFDITTLKPFDKVLVRQSDTDYWKPAFWGRRITSKSYPFITSFGHTTQAIPFKGNEWLVGTTEDCNDFYKTWV